MYNYELTEASTGYILMLNNRPVRVYSKYSNSKREAEEKANDVVNKSIQQHGISKVFYNGIVSVVTLANNFFNKIKSC